MKQRQLWIVLAIVACALAVLWALLEAVCGARVTPVTRPGETPQATHCVAAITPFPYIVLALALIVLAVVYWRGDRIPAPEKPLHHRILWSVGWTVVTVVFGFAVMDITGAGLYVMPFAAILLIVGLWNDRSGPWALGGGAALAILSAALQYFNVLHVPHREPLAEETTYWIQSLPALITLAAGGVAAMLGAVFWPRIWSLILGFLGTAAAWSTIWFPGHHFELNAFVLPAALLMTIGWVRSLLGFMRVAPRAAKAETDFSELDATRPAQLGDLPK